MTTNPYYPLPPDYNTLTIAGQRKARVASCCRQATPREVVESWALFRSLYLLHPEDNFHDARQLKASPLFHYQLVSFATEYLRNVIAAPRGSAKSKVIAGELPLFLSLSRPGWSTILCTATERLVENQMALMMMQLTENRRIIDDFGRMAPTKAKGQRIWTRAHLHLMNNSRIMGIPAKSKKRGLRPSLFLLDDPEFDPSHSTSTDTLRDDFEYLLFQVILPMLDPGCGIYWLGTVINRQSFIWHALNSDGKSQDSDPRFSLWHRHIFKAEWKDEVTGERKLLWPERLTAEFLDEKKATMGTAAYSAEYLNMPLSSTERILALDEDYDTYNILGRNDTMVLPRPPKEPCRDPLGSHEVVQYVNVPPCRMFTPTPELKTLSPEEVITHEPVQLQMDAGQMFSKMLRFAIVDRAYSFATHADYSCIHVLGMDKTTLWSLDLWLGRAREDEFVEHLFRMGMAWRVAVIGVEAVGVQIQLYEKAAEYITTEGQRALWRPRVIPIRYDRSESKAARIAGLEWRFNQHRIKLPWHRRSTWPYSELFNQIENFTMDLALLRHDDAIDTLANYIKVVRHQGGYEPPPINAPPESFEAQLEQHLRTGLPIGNTLEGRWDDEFIEKAFARTRNIGYTKDSGKPEPRRLLAPRSEGSRSCLRGRR